MNFSRLAIDFSKPTQRSFGCQHFIFLYSLPEIEIPDTWTNIPPLRQITENETEEEEEGSSSPDLISTDVTDHSPNPPRGGEANSTAATEEVISIGNIAPVTNSGAGPLSRFRPFFRQPPPSPRRRRTGKRVTCARTPPPTTVR